MRAKSAQAIAFALLALGASSARAQSRQQLAVMDFEARNVDAALAESVTDAAVTALRELRVFKVISRAEIRQMLSVDRDRATLSSKCTESSCLAEIGSALGARFLVVGTVSALDRQAGPWSVKVQLFDMRKAEVADQQTRPDLKTSREAIAAGGSLATLVVRPMLDKEQGFLEIACREAGAKVSIDGRLVGVTPFPVQKLGWGPHRVVIEKEGFIAWAKDVQIEKNQATTETVTLIPSPDFIQAYRSRNSAMRTGAWIASGLAVAGAGAAAYLQFGKADSIHERFAPLQDAFAGRGSVEAACNEEGFGNPGDEPSTYTGACHARADELAQEGSNYQWAARGALGVAVVAAGAATWFWLAGEDPGRYDAFLAAENEAPPVTASVVPLSGGAVASLGVQF